MVLTGLERVALDPSVLRGERVGLLAHPAAVDSHLRHSVDVLREAGVDLRALFGPQHGFTGHTQDNMIEWRSHVDRRTGLPVHSLYGDTRKPSREMLSGLTCIVCDLVDVGARYYTFAWTLRLVMEACAEHGLRVVVLDRPNPIGGAVEGSILKREWRSFVGMHEVPPRHGMTLGEFARMMNEEDTIGCDLVIVEMAGWTRSRRFDETGLPWVMPSPNMPTVDTALVYPGTCLVEGTTLSEGRGTTRPFELVGAPDVDAHALAERLHGESPPGVRFRPVYFEPTFQKHAGQVCGGVQLHVTDADAFRPVHTAISILVALRRLAPDAWAWRRPPYEYERTRLPFDVLAGGPELREMIDRGTSADAIAASWADDEASFLKRREPFLSRGTE